MSTIVTRAGKGTALTNIELDANFTNLNNDKLESSWSGSSSLVTLGNVTSGTWSASNIGLGKGGTGAALTAVTGGIVYSTASSLSITSAGTSGQLMTSGGAGSPTWTTPSSLSVGSANNLTGGSQNQIVYQSVVGTTSYITSPASSNTVLTWNGSSFTWGPRGTSVTLTDDTTTNATRYLVFEDITSGTMTTANVSSTKLTFNPSSGTLSATLFNSLSDETVKENVTKISDATSIINSLNGIEFTWKDNAKKSAGVIAQEIENVLPHLVEETDGVKSVNYNGIIAYLIEALKQQQSVILSQETRISALEMK